MTRAWEVLDRVETEDGALELRRRAPRDFLVTLGGRVLMNSAASRSEVALAELACQEIAGRRAARVLIGGLGLGCTLRAALDALPSAARVVVAELHEAVHRWCRGPLAELTGGAVQDPRVTVVIRDVAEIIAAAGPAVAARFDAILLDLYEGPRGTPSLADPPHFGPSALARTRTALRPGGILAVWCEDPVPSFERSLRAAGFATRVERPRRGGRRHAIYLARIGTSNKR